MITYTLLAIIAVFSVYCFTSPAAMQKYLFYPYAIKRENEHYRFLTHAFIHGDYLHLMFNVLALYSFGHDLETRIFPVLYDSHKLGSVVYLFLFTGGIYAASFTEYMRNRDNPSYSSLGASGAISSILFVWILLNPTGIVALFFIPMPGWLVGILLLAVSFYLIRRKRKGTYQDGISHEAHFWGALFGIAVIAISKPWVLKAFYLQVVSALT
jgi:membrane associated rhomboid family serine protease